MSTASNHCAVVFSPGLGNGGGAERYAVALAVSLAARRSRTLLATTGDVTKESLTRQFGLPLDGVELMMLPDVPSWARRLPHALFTLIEDARWIRSLRAIRPDLFLNSLFRSEMVGVGHVNVYMCHFPQRLPERWTPWARRMYMQIVGAVRGVVTGSNAFPAGYDAVVANSEFTARHVKGRWGVDAQVLYPPCPTMALEGVAKTKTIIAVGRFEPYIAGVPNKRTDVLIDTFSRMTDLHQEGWRLTVAGACSPGNAAYLSALKRKAGDTPVDFKPNVSFDELRRLYSEATIYWHAQGYGESTSDRPESQEHFGITTVEAMSAGCIPVVIDTAGPREVVMPVDGAVRWSTIDQMEEGTRAIVSMTAAELMQVQDRCRRRAEQFSGHAFDAHLEDLLAGLGAARGH